jgi:3-(3-hydroxy-phenyl)propionate hydroxylase
MRQRGKKVWLLELLNALHGPPGGFTLLVFGPQLANPVVEAGGVKARVLAVSDEIEDAEGLLARRYDARPGTVYLIRPDHHVAARWRAFDTVRIQAALRRATAQP